MMPSLAQLTYFFEVSNTLNLSKAAKNLKISQPALSRAIQNLESTVGTNLLIRHAKGVKLTPAGQKIFLQIRSMVQDWQETKFQALASQNQVQGKIKLGCPASVGLLMHGGLMDLLEKYPDLELELRHAQSDTITDEVINFSVDIGLVTNPIHYPDLIIRKIGETDITFWVGAGKSNLQNLNSGEAVLICDPKRHYTKLLLQQCKASNLKFKRILKVNSPEVIANLTANGCGIGLLTSCFTKSLFVNRLERVPNVPVIKEDLCLIYRKEYRHVAAVAAVVNTIKEWTKNKV